MKITKTQLKQIIKEELNGILNEADWEEAARAAEERAYADIERLGLNLPPEQERYIISNMKHLYIKNPEPSDKDIAAAYDRGAEEAKFEGGGVY